MIPGDFNADNQVDAADFVKWRKGLDTVYTLDDYAVWRANFGNGVEIASGAGSFAPGAVPEPTTSALAILAAASAALARRRRFVS